MNYSYGMSKLDPVCGRSMDIQNEFWLFVCGIVIL